MFHGEEYISTVLSTKKVRWGPKRNMWNCGAGITVGQEWTTVGHHSRALAVGSLEFGDFFWERGDDVWLLFGDSGRQRPADVALMLGGGAGT